MSDFFILVVFQFIKSTSLAFLFELQDGQTDVPRHRQDGRVHQAEGCRTRLERDQLPGQNDDQDGQAQEVLLGESRCPRRITQVPLGRPQD